MQKFTHARGVSGVYVIVHIESAMSYIGSSADIAQRWFNHRGTARRGVHPNPRFQSAWNEHGEDAFIFLIVERVAQVSDLREREQWWLDQGETYEPHIGFNLSRRSDTVGFRFSEEQRARLSKALTGKPKSVEHRAAMSARMLASPDELEAARVRMAALGRSGKGVPKKAAHRRKIGAAQRGGSNHMALLTEARVVEIMWRIANGERAIDLAAEYGVSANTIGKVKAGRVWTHLTRPK